MSRTAERMVDRIVADISDRKGLGNEWESIDALTQYEIRKEWERIIDEERA